jgi:hypothetical protein
MQNKLSPGDRASLIDKTNHFLSQSEICKKQSAQENVSADFAFLCPVSRAIIDLCQNHFFLLQFLRNHLYQIMQDI